MTLDYLLSHANEDIRGYICSSPAIGKLGISPVLLGLAKAMNWMYPSFSMDTGLNIHHVSRDEEWVEESKQDKHYHSRGTPRLAMELQATARQIHANADKLNYPILMIHGDNDLIIGIDGTRDFFANTTQADKTKIEYEQGYHELFNDIERERVLSDVHNWIEKRL